MKKQKYFFLLFLLNFLIKINCNLFDWPFSLICGQYLFYITSYDDNIATYQYYNPPPYSPSLFPTISPSTSTSPTLSSLSPTILSPTTLSPTILSSPLPTINRNIQIFYNSKKEYVISTDYKDITNIVSYYQLMN